MSLLNIEIKIKWQIGWESDTVTFKLHVPKTAATAVDLDFQYTAGEKAQHKSIRIPIGIKTGKSSNTEY